MPRGRRVNAASPCEQHVKRDVRERDGYCCTECGMNQVAHLATFGRGLEVHRITPGVDYTVEGCVTLCRTCHMKKPKSHWGTTAVVKLRPRFHKVILAYAEQNCMSVKEAVQYLCRLKLEDLGLWPRPDDA